MENIARRLAAIDWDAVGASLDERGYATTAALLTADECGALAALYPDRSRFRSRIVMERLGYGVGEYKYFAAPLPRIVASMRTGCYARLAPIANRWAVAFGEGRAYPPALTAFIDQCRLSGQARPTPLILRYEAGGYNCMHQDLYGEVVFPIQLTCMLSRPGADYAGGEFLVMEQRPRMQPRCEAITLRQGEAIIFATRYRPVAGKRGWYRVNVRHGVSRVRSGNRLSLGIIFHDAR